MSTPKFFTVEETFTGWRIDVYLTDMLEGFTRSAAQKLIDGGMVQKAGRVLAKNYKLQNGDVIEVTIPQPVPIEAQPQAMALDVIFEDEYLLVINKPKGLVVHPGAGNKDGTLVNGVLYHAGGSLSGIGGVLRPGIVHRIDKDTSGLLVVAKTDVAHTGLSAQLAAHTMQRSYEAVVYYNVKEDSGVINAPIGRSEQNRTKMAVNFKNGKPAVTNYKVISRLRGFTHVDCKLETGRTHQIRVHMASIGHPIAGDTVYGPKKAITSLKGQCLHAKTLGFTHPVTGKVLHFTSPLPLYFTKFLELCSKGGE